MLKTTKWLLIVIGLVLWFNACSTSEIYTVTSPNDKLAVNFWLTEKGEPVYTVTHSNCTLLEQSKLGLFSSYGDFYTDLVLDSVSKVDVISDQYELLIGKKSQCKYTGNRRIFYLKNQNSKPMEIIFQVSDDGVAFRYHLTEKMDTTITIFKELSSYNFNASTKAFLQPCPNARTGWNFTQPSYEEYYEKGILVGTRAPYQAGWVMPALFNYDNYWISITETAVDTNYCGSRLSQFSPNGEYSVQLPQPQETIPGASALPKSELPLRTPWRIIAISEGLDGLVESTLGTDLAPPAKYDVFSWLRPGTASWSWVIHKDDSTVYDVQKRYIDFAAEMNWEYCLIDAFWDTQIGYDKIEKLADYAQTKNVKLLLWYNSAGDWNTTPLTPRDKLLTEKSRRAEFQKLENMGIAGIKVDFFGGDGQSMMKYYIDILKDAAKYKLTVNFHGCTFPRGWHRTYPNLMTMEAIKGEEYITFTQENADQQPTHCTMLPFTRNLFDPMDFTPVNLSGIPNIKRRTTKGFEIALSVLFTSGIQHIAETPVGMAEQKGFVKEFIQKVPVNWDNVKFIDGYPGKYVVLARQKNATWYIAGINGKETERKVKIDLSFISNPTKGFIITNSNNGNELVKKNINISEPINITIEPHSGFVIKVLTEGEKR